MEKKNLYNRCIDFVIQWNDNHSSTDINIYFIGPTCFVLSSHGIVNNYKLLYLRDT